MRILGLLHAPDLDAGPRPELRFAGLDAMALPDSARTRIRAREMGFVFQDFNLIPTLSAEENVVLACDYAGLRGQAGTRAAQEALDLVGPRGSGQPPAGGALRRRTAPSPGRS